MAAVKKKSKTKPKSSRKTKPKTKASKKTKAKAADAKKTEIKWKCKSWREKLRNSKGVPKVVDIPPRMQRRFGTGTMLVPAPCDVDALIKKVRKGKLVTQSQIRAKLARDHGADSTCPMTTGIFLRIAAEAAEEDLRDGKTRITPYWRVVRDTGELIDKLPGGALAQAGRLGEEGHVIDAGSAMPKVRDFKKNLFQFD